MRRLLITLAGCLIWATGGVLLAQNLEWENLARFFQYRDTLKVNMDPVCLDKLDNWEDPGYMELPAHLKSALLRPYFIQTHPAQTTETDWNASALFQDELYTYAYKRLAEGHALILLGQGINGPYLLLLTYTREGGFVDALSLYADYRRQGMRDQRQSEWISPEVLRVKISSTWEDPSLRQTRTDTSIFDFKLQSDGRISPLSNLSTATPNR